MENKKIETITKHFSTIGTISALLSIVITVSGFLYILCFIIFLTGNYIIFPVTTQDIFIASKRPLMIVAIILFIYITNINKYINYYINKYYILNYISNIIYNYTIFFSLILFLSMYFLWFPFIINKIFSYLIIIFSMLIILLINKFSLIKYIEVLICIIISVTSYDILLISKSNINHKIITTDNNIIYGKIYLYLSDGIFTISNKKILYIKSSSIKLITSYNSNEKILSI